MALLHRDRDHVTTEVPDHPPDDWSAAPAAPTTTATTTPAVVRRNSMGQTLRTVVATICVAAIAAFLLLNPDDVQVDLGFETYEAALWVVAGIAAGVGVVLGFALGHRRCHREHI